MKAGNIARAVNSPQQFDINHLFGNVYELTHTDNIHKVTVTDRESDKKRTEYEYSLYLETVSVDNYDDMVSALVALKYTLGDEISLMRKGITDSENEEYAVYLAYVTACKTFAREYYGVQNVTHD